MSFKLFSEFSFFFLVVSVLFCLFVSLFFVYNFILHIENFYWLTVLTFKDCNYSLPRNLASPTKFYYLIYEKSELFILSDSLALSDMLQTLTKSADWIMDQQVIDISNIPIDCKWKNDKSLKNLLTQESFLCFAWNNKNHFYVLHEIAR